MSKFKAKFIDGSTDGAEEYQAKITPMIRDAAMAEELIDIDGLERYASERPGGIK
jgi:hypothetical protein